MLEMLGSLSVSLSCEAKADYCNSCNAVRKLFQEGDGRSGRDFGWETISLETTLSRHVSLSVSLWSKSQLRPKATAMSCRSCFRCLVVFPREYTLPAALCSRNPF